MLATQGTEFARTQGSLAEAQAENARREQVAEELRRALATQAAELSRTQGSLAEAQAENARREQWQRSCGGRWRPRRRSLPERKAPWPRRRPKTRAGNRWQRSLRRALATQAAEFARTQGSLAEAQADNVRREEAAAGSCGKNWRPRRRSWGT